MKINYEDKVTLNSNPLIADINKVKADDMNEIKNVVNANADIMQGLKGTVLWTNTNHTSSFASQTITLDVSMSNFDCYEIIYRNVNGENVFYNTGKIPKNHGCRLLDFYVSGGNFGLGARTRIIDYTNDTHLTAQVGRFAQAGSSGKDDNNVCIPEYIIGYKTEMFNT